MIKLLELAEKPNTQRIEFWKSLDIFKEKVEFIDATPVSLEGKWSGKDFQSILVDESFSAKIISRFHELPAEVIESQCIDSVFFEKDHWWPRCLLRGAFRYWITEKNSHLDNKKAAYVSGSGPHAGAAVASLINLGFSKINLMDQNEIQLEEMAAKLRRRFFGIDFLIIRDSELTLQPNDGSILVNTVTATSGPDLLEDLSYLNFLNKQGLVIDVPMHETQPALLSEAKEIGVKLVGSNEIQAHCDFSFLERLNLTKDLSFEAYFSQWSEFLSKNPTKV